jgi:hypothetical protein
MKLLRTALASILALTACLSLGQSVLGRWKGQISVLPIDKNIQMTEQERQVINVVMKTLKNVRVLLTLAPNKSYTAVFTGLPRGEKQKNEGSWKLEGNKLWLTAKITNGKPSKVKKPQAVILSKDRKTLTLMATGTGQGSGRRIVFRR